MDGAAAWGSASWLPAVRRVILCGMTLALYVLFAWALLSGALTAVVAVVMAREHLRAARRGQTLTPGDDLLGLQQAPSPLEPGPHPAY